MMPLAPDFAFGLDSFRPVYDQSVARATVMRRHLLGPLEWTIAGMSKANRYVRFGSLRSDLIQMLLHLFSRRTHTVVIQDRIVCANEAALGAHAVVAQLVEEDRVIENAQLFKGLNQPAGIPIGMLGKVCEVLHQSRTDKPFIIGEFIPRLYTLGPTGQLRVGGHDTGLLLSNKCLFAKLV